MSNKAKPSMKSVWDGQTARARDLLYLPRYKKQDTAARRGVLVKVARDEAVVLSYGPVWWTVSKEDGQQCYVQAVQVEGLFRLETAAGVASRAAAGVAS